MYFIHIAIHDLFMLFIFPFSLNSLCSPDLFCFIFVLFSFFFRRLGLRPPRGILMHGPPGGGKTSLARALARGAQAAFVALDAAATFSSFLGEAERAIRDAFATARANRPCIVFLDELDALVTKRDMGDSGEGGGGGGGGGRSSGGGGAAESMAARVLSTLLNEMDGVEAAEGVLVVAATNRVDRIDAALLRPGRFDHVVLVPAPDAATAEAVIRAHARRMPLAAGVDLAVVAVAARAALGPQASGAQLANVCREAAMAALRRARRLRLRRDEVFVEQQDFDACIALLTTAAAAASGKNSACSGGNASAIGDESGLRVAAEQAAKAAASAGGFVFGASHNQASKTIGNE